MAENAADADDFRARELDLLESGNFSDVEIVCGERSWKCHRAILTSRSVWFRKAFSGPFQEASSKQVSLSDENPTSVDFALKHIYGGGLDVDSSVSEEHFIEECVSLWRIADFLLLKSLQSSVEKAIHSYCDKRMKQLCTRGNKSKWQQHNMGELSPWALDLLLGIRQTYKLNIEGLKAVLMEFIWAGRSWTMSGKSAKLTLEHLKDTPAFVTDLLSQYGSGPWLINAVWAPHSDKGKTVDASSHKCYRCGKELLWEKSQDAAGQIIDPFGLTCYLKFDRAWCRDCGKLDMIPWREEEANDE